MTKNQLPIIKALWIGGALGEIENLALRSFIACGHIVHLFTYDKVENIPSGVIVRDGNEIFPKNEIFYYKSGGSVSAFSNLFRYQLLYKEGGIWVDTDVVCLKAFDIDSELVFGKEQSDKFNTAVLGAKEPHHPLFEFMTNHASSPNSFLPFDSVKTKRRKLVRKYLQGNNPGNIKWGEIGPNGLTNAVKYLGYENHARPVTHFYPIHPSCWDTIFDCTYPSISTYFPDTYAIHIWNEMTNKKSGFNKNATFPENSLIEALKRKFSQ